MTAQAKQVPLHQALEALQTAKKVDIRGKQYATVATRIEIFRRYFPAYSIHTELNISGVLVRVKATIADEKDRAIATGHAEESRDQGKINKTSAVENAETSAVGRALAMFGLAGHEIASADEVVQAISQQTPEDHPWFGPLTKTKLKEVAREMFKELQACDDPDGLLAFLNTKEFMAFAEQIQRDTPDWWNGVNDQAGFSQHIETRRATVTEANFQREAALHP